MKEQHFAKLKRGVDVWNEWYERHDEVIPQFRGVDLSGADLRGVNLKSAHLIRANLIGADLSGADLRDANLIRANLIEANLSRADLSRANLIEANLSGAYLIKTTLTDANLSAAYLVKANLIETNLKSACLSGTDFIRGNIVEADLSGADLSRANLIRANLNRTNLRGANLSMANLSRASLIDVNLQNTVLVGCRIFGLLARNLDLTNIQQHDLVVSREGDPIITVDNLEVAQFVYLLLNHEEIQGLIQFMTTKLVLIVGRFISNRRMILDAVREELRRRGYIPITIDFEQSLIVDLVEVVSILAPFVRFLIVDFTNAQNIPQNLQSIISSLPFVAVQPIIEARFSQHDAFEYFGRYPWVLPLLEYEYRNKALSKLGCEILEDVEAKAHELYGT